MDDGRADLVTVAGCAALATAVVVADVLPGVVRAIAGLALVLLLPGYALARAVLEDLRGGAAEVAVLSLALSVAATIAVGLVVNLSTLSLTVEAWALGLLLVTLVACAVAARRPARWLRGGRWRTPRARDVVLLAAAALVAAGAAALGSTPLSPPDGVRGYTELSQLRDGDAIVLEVTANELRPAGFRLDLRADGRLVRRWRTGTLEPGRAWRTRMPVAGARGGRTLEARLYRPSSARPYRRVRLELRRART